MTALPEPYYAEPANGVYLYNGDCRELLPLLVAAGRADPAADLLLTDPPYGNATSTANMAGRRGGRSGANFANARAVDHPPVFGDDAPFDPYMGSGPFLRAAKDLRLGYVGVEVEQAYCDRAVERARQEVLL